MAGKQKNEFGAFAGVFTPSILTILGVIMFMNAGSVVGYAGLLGAIVILILCKSITSLTSLSISAISTNMDVKGGGSYYLISRSLGAEPGGAIGVSLYLALALSVPFYIIGLDDRYKLKSKLWKSVDLTPEMLKDWFNYYRPRVGGYSPLPYGAFINGPDGERIGLWYSVVDWRLTGTAIVRENNEVTILMPTDEGHRKKDRNPYDDEFSVSNEKNDDPVFFWLSRYSAHADRLGF